ncbi:MAG: PA14 domain-containing protein [Candidatus Promineifilaceae bacterium]|nr:PA14 domain-containing protein [Candidatus Promineifilaceae bacterium]
MVKKFALFTLLILMMGTAPSLLRGPQTVSAADSKWRAKYWNNPDLKGDPAVERDEDAINFDWGGGSPSDKINDGDFSARWKRTVYFNTGTYRFTATMDDGMRVWVDETKIIDNWVDGQARSVSTDMFLSAGEYEIKVEYYEAKGQAVAKFSWAPVSGLPPVPVERWRGEYFSNKDLVYPPALVRDDNTINFDWGAGSPWPGIPNDRFSVRWTRATPMDAGVYRFTILTDDGVRLRVNNQLLIDQWHDNQSATFTADVSIPGGVVPIQLDYFENQGAALVSLTVTKLQGTAPGPTPPQPPAPPPPQGNTAVIVNARFLNVRSTPETGDNVIAFVAGGQVVTLIGRNGGWVKVRLPSGLEGWVGGSYLNSGVPLETLPVVR